jgi:exodeoxyribonuclease VII small subunit
MSEKPQADLQGLSFEAAFQQLREIVDRIETPGISLEEALHLYEQGRVLGSYCAQLLNKAELRVKSLDATPNPPQNNA